LGPRAKRVGHPTLITGGPSSGGRSTGDPVAAALTALGFSTISEFVGWGGEATRAQLDAAMATIYAFIQLSQ